MLVEILIGIPGSGKSTYAKECASHARTIRISKDDIRKKDPSLKEKQVVAEESELLKASMEMQYDHIIMDNTHLNPVHWVRIEGLAKEAGYDVSYTWFDESLDPDLCHKRNLGKDRDPVPWTVIENMYNQYFKHWMEREEFVILQEGKPAIIVDIDGTVADNDGHRGWFDWMKVGGDKPHHDIIDLVMLLSEKHHVIFMSGRDSICWEETNKWLSYHFSDLDDCNWSLFMRAEGDMRKDSIIKRELFQEHVNGKYRIAYVLDDRWQVVRQWRAMGLRCLSVDNGFK